MLIWHSKLYDERSNSSWKASDMVAELFKQIRDVYAAILDFSFSVKQHLSAGKLGWYLSIDSFVGEIANSNSQNWTCF